MNLTREQREALHNVYLRYKSEADNPTTYHQFRKTVAPGPGCIMVPCPWMNMWLGIEPDGYTHS